MKSPAKSKAWTSVNIERTRITTAKIVEQKCRAYSADKKLTYLAKQAQILESAPSDLEQLLRFFYILTMLEHHAEFGGLTPSRLTGLRNLACAILQTHGIKASDSQLSYLYSEIYLADARAFLGDGFAWRAAFEQQRALHLGRRGGRPVAAAIEFSLGQAALRLGQAELALDAFSEGESAGLSAEMTQLVRLQRVRATRLAGNLDAATAMLDAFSGSSPESANAESWQWERLIQSSQRSGDIGLLTRAVRKGQPHYLGARILEAALHVRAARETSIELSLTAAAKLIQLKGLASEGERFLRSVALDFDDCYDPVVSLERSLAMLGKLAESSSRFSCIDHELRFWVALARWAARHHMTQLAALATGHYRSLSLRLSSGRQADVLGSASDLYERSWNSKRELSR